MSKLRSRLSSEGSPAKVEESEPEETTSSRFRALAKQIVSIPVEKVRAEEEREKLDKKASGKRRNRKP